MLVIRRDQFRAFEQARRATLSHRVMIHLRNLDRARGAQWNEADLEDQTRQAVENGLQFFHRDEDILRYCEVVVKRLGGWYERDRDVSASFLGSRSISPAKRIDNFERWAARRLGAPRAR